MTYIRKLLDIFRPRHEGETRHLLPCSDKTPVLENGAPLLGWNSGTSVQCWRCADCGYMFFDPPDPDILNAYYQDEYPKAAASWYTLENTYATSRSNMLAKLPLSFAPTFLGSDQVKYHESGCAFGAGVAALRSRGYDATGCELNKDAVAQGKAHGNLWISDESDSAFLRRTARRPNVVFSHHVVEHIPDVVGYLAGLKDLLDPQSIVVLAVPNAVSAVAMMKGFHQHAWFAYPGHLHMLSPRSLLCLAEKAGYELLHMDTQLAAATSEDDALLGVDPTDKVRSRRNLAVIEHTLMGAELRAVLTPAGGEVAQQFQATIRNPRTRCQLSGETESRLLEAYASPP